jgi:hypothetical protein
MPQRGNDEREEIEVTPAGALAGQAWDEFTVRLNELAVAHIFAVRGLRPQADELMRMGGEPDKAMRIVPAPPWKDGAPSYGKMRIRDVPGYLAKGGQAEALIGHMWIVAVYTDWEEGYREMLAEYLGMREKDDLLVSAFGDLRLFRHDIAHNRGVASAKNSGKAEVFQDWTTDGELIVIGENQILAFMEHFGLVERADQDGTDEMLGLMQMANSERERLGVEKITLRRVDDSSAALPVVQCPVCKQRSRTAAAVCPKCGSSLSSG